MIFLIFSILLVYPDNNEKIDDLFIVISEIGETLDFNITIDGLNITGDYEISENTLIIRPQNVDYGIHTITLFTPYDTISHTFTYIISEEITKKKIVKNSKTIYELGFFANHISTNPDNPIIEVFGGLSGFYPYFNYRIYLNTYDLYSDEQLKSQFRLSCSLPFLSVILGDQYPELSRLALNSRRITGLYLGLFKKIGFFYGDMTRKRGDTPQSTITGFLFGPQDKKENYFRLTLLRGRELNPSSTPYDNAVLGLNIGVKLFSYVIDGGIFGSIYTMDRNLKDTIINLPEAIFTVNSSTIPLFPTKDILSYYLDIYNSNRRFNFTHYGKSFYNRMNYGVIQGLWKFEYYDIYRFNDYILSVNMSLSKINNYSFRFHTSFSFPYNSILYILNAGNGLSHTVSWGFSRFININTYLYLGNSKRITLTYSYPFIIEPSLKLEFSKGSKPYYEIGAGYRFKYFYINPRVSYYNGSVAGILGFNAFYKRFSFNFNLQYSSINYRIFVNSYYSNELPL